MKKALILVLIIFSFSIFAQRKHTISGLLNSGLGDQIGLSYELQKETKFFGMNTSQIINLTIGYIDLYYIAFPEIIENGKGIVGQYGYRFYLNKQKTTRWYVQNSVSAGYIVFKGSNVFKNRTYNYDYSFSFISLFQPEVGHKFVLGRFSIDPAIGWQWNIELNKNGSANDAVDNTFVKVAVKVGYSF